MSRLVGTVLCALVISTSGFGLTTEPSETEDLSGAPFLIDRWSMDGREGPAAAQVGDNVLVHGSPYGALSSVSFDDSDRLYVGGLIIDPESGSVIDEPSLNTCTGETSYETTLCVRVSALTIGPDGSLYWSGLVDRRDAEFLGTGVGRRTPDGVTTVQLVDPQANEWLSGRDHHITFSEDGRLFVVSGYFGDRLFEVDPELVEPPRLVIETLGWLKGFDFGPDGFLYGPIWTEDRVVRIDVDADPPTAETVFDGHHVSAVKFDSQGRLAATDYGSGEVLRADVDTGSVEVIAQLAEGLNGLAFDSTDRLYVCSRIDGFIVEVVAGGDARTVVPGGLLFPLGVAVMPGAEGDRVFVADMWSLREIDGATGQQLGLTPAGFAPDGLRYPVTKVAPHGDALLLTSRDVVQVLDPEQGTILEEYTDFFPTSVISFRGDVVVADWGGQDGPGPRVLRLGGSGTETLMDASQGLRSPTFLAANEEDLWVADCPWGTSNTKAIWQLVAGGETLATPVPVMTDRSCPWGLTVDAAGRLLFVDSGPSLSRLDPQTGTLSVLVDGLPPLGLGFLNGPFALGASGAVYLTSLDPPTLYRFDLETFYIPAAAHKAGAAGTQWVTDLTIHNRADTRAAFAIDLLPKRQDNSAPETVSFSLEPSSSVGYDDALDGLFNFSGAAALRVRASSGDLVVGSRTYNDQPEGTYGQHIAGFPEDEALMSGDQGLLIGLSHGADYRTNIGLASACGAPISVNVTLYTADGAQLGQRTVELAPYSYVQVTDIFADFSTTDVEHGFAVVESSSPGAWYFAYASVIDNRTGDAAYIPAR